MPGACRSNVLPVVTAGWAGVGAVHSVVVGNTDASDSSVFDLLLVFTGGAQFIGGESSMKKLRVQAGPPCPPSSAPCSAIAHWLPQLVPCELTPLPTAR